MWKVTWRCGKCPKFGKLLNMWGNDNYLTNGLKMFKMTQKFGKQPKYLGNGLDTWGTA